MTATQDLGIWRRTSVGYVADASTIKAHGGSRKVCLPGSSIRIADLEWEPVKDVYGKVVAWRRNACGGWVVIRNDTVASSAESLEAPWRMSLTKEDEMSKKPKARKGSEPTQEHMDEVSREMEKEHERQAAEAPKADEAPKAEVKVAKAPKPIAYEPAGEVKAVKAGTKLAALIDELGREEGTTLDLLAAELSRTGSPVDSAGVRSWISYDLRRVGLGCRQDGDRLFLVLPDGMASPLPHREATPPKSAETKAEPQLKVERGSKSAKRAAMRPPKKSKAAAR